MCLPLHRRKKNKHPIAESASYRSLPLEGKGDHAVVDEVLISKKSLEPPHPSHSASSMCQLPLKGKANSETSFKRQRLAERLYFVAGKTKQTLYSRKCLLQKGGLFLNLTALLWFWSREKRLYKPQPPRGWGGCIFRYYASFTLRLICFGIENEPIRCFFNGKIITFSH